MKDFRNYLLEGLVILISVLAAFWLEDYRENRNDTIQLRNILTLLEEELSANEKLLDSVIRKHEKIRAAVNKSQQNNSTHGFHSDAVIEMANYKPQTASLQTLYNSGLIGKIENKQLQVQISAWDEHLSNLIEHERWSLEIRNEMRKHIANFNIRIDLSEGETDINRNTTLLNFLTMRVTEEARAIESALKFKEYMSATRQSIEEYLEHSSN